MKGQVENQVGLVRERFFAPRLRVKNYDELNAWLMDQVLRYAKAHRHPEQRDRTIWEMISTEFEPSKVAQARKHLDPGGLADLIEPGGRCAEDPRCRSPRAGRSAAARRRQAALSRHPRPGRRPPACRLAHRRGQCRRQPGLSPGGCARLGADTCPSPSRRTSNCRCASADLQATARQPCIGKPMQERAHRLPVLMRTRAAS